MFLDLFQVVVIRATVLKNLQLSDKEVMKMSKSRTVLMGPKVALTTPVGFPWMAPLAASPHLCPTVMEAEDISDQIDTLFPSGSWDHADRYKLCWP